MRGSGAEWNGGCVTANPDCMGSVCEEVQCLVAECGAQTWFKLKLKLTNKQTFSIDLMG